MHKVLNKLQQFFARSAEWILITLTIVFLVLSAVLDWFAQEPFVNVIILAMGLTSAGLVTAVKESLEPLDERMGRLEQRLEPIWQQIVKLDENVQDRFAVQVLKGRRENYAKAIALVTELAERKEEKQTCPELLITDFAGDRDKQSGPENNTFAKIRLS